MTADQAYVALSTKTGMSPDEWRDFLSCSPDQQKVLARVYAEQNWAKSRDTLADVIGIFETAGAIAGAASAIVAFAALL